MPSFAAPGGFGTGRDLELDDARASLAYWQGRARRLPRRALRKRREAREMAARWEARVAEAERAAYGRGLAGALLMVLAEGRMPQPVRRAGRRAGRVLAATAATITVLAVTLTVLAIAVLWSLAQAIV